MKTKITDARNLISSVTILAILMAGFYMFFEPSIIQAQSSPQDDNVTVQLNVTGEISISAPGTIVMSPDIDLTNNSAIGDGDWNVITNNVAGYDLDFRADQDPAMQHLSEPEQFDDAVATPATWGFGVGEACDGSDPCFGFSVHGDDALGVFGSATSCGAAGSPNGDYRGFNGTTDIPVAERTSETSMSGSITTMCVHAEQDSVFAASGTYETVVTGTATTK